MRDQCRWFGGMVGNHVADIVAKYGDTGEVPQALNYIKGREGYDYNETAELLGQRPYRVRAGRDRGPLLRAGHSR